MDVIGFQRYGLAQIKIGWNGGNPYPGNKVKNYCWGGMGFSFGATCKEGESIMSFGPTVHPQGLEECLREAVRLGHPVDITEIGCDAKLHKWGERGFKLDEETQRETMERYAPILARFKEQIRTFFVWTPYVSEEMDQPGQLEWNRGPLTRLGMIKIQKDENRQIQDWEYSLAGNLLRDAFCQVRDGS